MSGWSTFADGEDCPDCIQYERDITRLKAELAKVTGERDALVMAVAQKFPNESRYETALRYITERENQTSTGEAAKVQSK